MLTEIVVLKKQTNELWLMRILSTTKRICDDSINSIETFGTTRSRCSVPGIHLVGQSACLRIIRESGPKSSPSFSLFFRPSVVSNSTFRYVPITHVPIWVDHFKQRFLKRASATFLIRDTTFAVGWVRYHYMGVSGSLEVLMGKTKCCLTQFFFTISVIDHRSNHTLTF